MKLDIIIPINNNEKQINKFYDDVKEILKNIKYNFIFVDNSSTDDSLNALRKIYKSDDDHIKIISLSKSYTENDLIHIGLKYTKSDLICVMNIEDNLSHVLKMYKFLNENKDYDCVCNCNKNVKNNIFRKIAIKYTKRNTDINNLDELSTLKMFRKNMLTGIMDLSNKYGYSNAIFSKIGFNIYYDNTYMGETNKDSLTNYIFRYSDRPSKFVTIFGYILTTISIFYMIYMFIFSLNKISLLIFILLLNSGINFIVIGVLCNYLTKSLCIIKSNQTYIIKEIIGIDENYL
ncbi:MAG: glycosyltransferase [Bacilli bacterium]|nr:glycosyltransferase [Bacilli bacterium]